MDKLDLIQIKQVQDFPGGSVDGSMPVNAGDTGSTPGPGRFHMPRGNSDCEPQLPKPVHLESVFFNRRSCCDENPVPGHEESARWLQLEKKLNKETNNTKKKKKLGKKFA